MIVNKVERRRKSPEFCEGFSGERRGGKFKIRARLRDKNAFTLKALWVRFATQGKHLRANTMNLAPQGQMTDGLFDTTIAVGKIL